MRVQVAQVRTAGLAAAVVALLAAGLSGCSKGSAPNANVTPNIVAASSSSSSPSPSSAPATSDPGSGVPAGDPSAALAQVQQKTGCIAAIGPIFEDALKGTYGTTQATALAATPQAAKQSMQQSFTLLNDILKQDPNALVDGNASKARKPFENFCATPAGAPLVGSTPADALKPVKPVKTVPPPKPTTHH